MINFTLSGCSLLPEKLKPDIQTKYDLAPDREGESAAIQLVKSLKLSHYLDVNDTVLAERVIDNYFRALDRYRIYFLASDIEEYSIFKQQLWHDAEITRVKDI